MDASHRRFTVLSCADTTMTTVFAPRECLRVVIADDHPHYRAGLGRELRANGIDVVAEVPNAMMAIAAVAHCVPDVVILDLNMPGAPADEAIRRLRERVPSARVVVLTVSGESPDMTDAMLSGAAGYVLKDDLPEHIVRAVRTVAAGETCVSPRVASMLLTRARGVLEHEEIGMLELLADGRPGQEIVETCMGSGRSVRQHLISILLKLADDEHRGSLRLVRGHSA
jgi:DNA-binding NarL/FixJ family response regulator